MKKVIMVLAVTLMTTVCNAQFFVGGSLGLTTSSNFSENTNSNTTLFDQSGFGFSINPRVGYFLNEKFSVGAGVLFGINTNTNSIDPDNEMVRTSIDWGFAPFARYSVIEFGKFSVLGECVLNIGGGSSSEKTGAITVHGPSRFNFGINVRPVLSYKLSECVDLEAGLNFLNVGFTRSSSTNDLTHEQTTNTSFNLGADSGNVIGIGNLTIGAIFKF